MLKGVFNPPLRTILPDPSFRLHPTANLIMEQLPLPLYALNHGILVIQHSINIYNS